MGGKIDDLKVGLDRYLKSVHILEMKKPSNENFWDALGHFLSIDDMDCCIRKPHTTEHYPV